MTNAQPASEGKRESEEKVRRLEAENDELKKRLAELEQENKELKTQLLMARGARCAARGAWCVVRGACSFGVRWLSAPACLCA